MIPFLSCMIMVAHTAGLPPRVLPTVQAIEGGYVGSVTADDNGTADLGVMQINTIWVPALAARARLSEAATRTRLISDGCFNIAAAALIIRYEIVYNHGALLPAIGDFHSRTPALNAAYIKEAEDKAAHLFAPATRPGTRP